MKPLVGRLAAYLLPASVQGLKLGPEDRIGIDLAGRLRVASIEGRLIAVWLHVANEVGGGHGNKSRIAYAVAKALGTHAGIADLLFLWNGGSLAIELKAPGNTQTESQKLFEAWCAHANVPYHVCTSADEAEAILRAAGVLT